MMYASLVDLKTYLGISSTTDDALLTDLLERVTAAFESETGRVFEVTTSTTKYFDSEADVVGATLYIDDCVSLTTVTNGDAAVITSTYYVTEPRNSTPYYAITLKASSGYAWTYTTDPQDAITISGKWGYSLKPPDDVVKAIIEWAAQSYRGKDAQTIEAALAEQGVVAVQPGIPKAVLRVIQHYKRRI
jgi:hypothetical protein